MKPTSPFSLNRFEYEHTHHYYLPSHIWSTLRREKSVFLLGSRGTGKTTLLKALNWEEQLTNRELAEKLEDDFLTRSQLGVYVKLSLSPLVQFKSWPPGDEFFRGSVVSNYLDLLWSEALWEGLASLIARRTIRSRPSREFETTAMLVSSYPELFTSCASRLSFLALRDALYRRRRELEKLAVGSVNLAPDELNTRLPMGQIGELGRTSAELATAFLGTCSGHGGWQIKVCFDEAEYLDLFQQRVLNTAVRLANATVAYIVSLVRPNEHSISTLLPNVSLQRADRETVRLDSIEDTEFLELVEGVSQVRIRAITGGSDSIPFRTYDVLGRLDINALLEDILRTSEDRRALQLIASAKALREIYSDLDASSRRTSLPIYQAYLIDRLGLAKPSKDQPRARRAQDSAELRKRMVAAYLCICAELGKQVRYAYAEMVLQMSDKCVRDFLLQMDELFCTVKVPLEEFLAMQTTPNDQNEALRNASMKKREHVPESGVSAPTEILRLIEALGYLTTQLQTARQMQVGLRSSERGIFVLNIPNASNYSTLDRTLQLIAEGADAGFFRITKQTDQSSAFGCTVPWQPHSDFLTEEPITR